MIIISKLEKFEDDRGFICFASPETLKFDYKYLTMGTVTPGSKRGGHYHRRTFEKLLCLSGELVFVLDEHETVIKAGEIVDIPIGRTHTIENRSRKMASFVEFKSEEFNKEDKDVYSK